MKVFEGQVADQKWNKFYGRVQQAPSITVECQGRTYHVRSYEKKYQGLKLVQLFFRSLKNTFISFDFTLKSEKLREDWKTVFTRMRKIEVYQLVKPAAPAPASLSENHPASADISHDAASTAEPTFEMISERESLMHALTTNPASLLNEGRGPLVSMIDQPPISECSCKVQFSRGRKGPLDVRKILENSLVQKLQESSLFSKEKPLLICSIGSGGCFQELVIHARLVKEGYQVNWVLADPIYSENSEKPEEHPTIQQFTHLARQISPETAVQIQEDGLNAISEFAKEGRAEPDIILFIDFDLQKAVEVTPEIKREIEEYQPGKPFEAEYMMIRDLFVMRMTSNISLKQPRLVVSTREDRGNLHPHCKLWGIT